MCGRYAASKDLNALMTEFVVEEQVVQTPLAPDWNVAPTKQVYAVMERRPKGADAQLPVPRQLRVVRWGLVPSWAKDPGIGARMINARVETVAEKPSFRRAFRARRCLLPADGYYEWYAPDVPADADVPRTKDGKPRKQPFFIRPADGHSLAMAGLYEWWHDPSRPEDDPEAWLCTATIITTQATDAVGRIHDRMPLVVNPGDWDQWLDPDADDPDQLKPLLQPASPERLAAYPVSMRVNSVRNNGPELVEPLPLDDLPPDDLPPATTP